MRPKGRSRPPEENFPRSQETRSRILDAARRLFADEGFERTTIRATAAAAGIDPSMVMRYFGSKDGLFAAAMDFDLGLPDLSAGPADKIGETLVRHFLTRWEGPDAGATLPLLLRTAVTNTDAAERLQDVFRLQVAPVIARVTDARRARECAALVATQMVGLGYTRYVLKVPAVVALPQKVIVEQLGAVIQRFVEHGRD
jgi:AcrR family transcriptional regulator